MEPEPVAGPQPESTAPERPSTGRPSPLRVLLVDDDEDDFILTRDLLLAVPHHGYQIEWVRNGEAALAALAQDRHQVCLLDYRIGELDGLEVLRRSTAQGCQVPIILLTGQGHLRVDLEAMAAGAADFLPKSGLGSAQLERAVRYAVERAQTVGALRRSEQRFALAVQGANDGIWDWDVDANRLEVSTRWREILGLPAGETVLGIEAWLERVHPADLQQVRSALDAHLAGRSPQFEEESRVRHSDGGYPWVLMRGVALRDGAGHAYRMAGSLTDVTGRKIYDGLTSLPNRMLLLDRIEALLGRSQRRKGYLFGLFVLAIDDFKRVADSAGAEATDELLLAVARILETTLRPGDTVARLEGEEFALLVDELADVNEGLRIAERLRLELAKPMTVGDAELSITASIGIALSSTGYGSAPDCLRDARTAAHSAMSQRRSSCEIYDAGMREEAIARLRLESEFRRALDQREFTLEYQPVVDFAANRIVGFEALVRWPRATQVFVPGQFIPLAEATGLIQPLGDWVLAAALRSLHEWQRRRPEVLLFVNLSARQLSQPGLPQGILGAIRDAQVDVAGLKLEITESALIEDPVAAAARLAEIHALGVGLCIDDFGTGYSSLSLLRQIQFDTLKIDRSFVESIATDSKGFEVVRAIIALARSLGMEVVAEGVETPEQLQALAALGCRIAQGYFFSRPVRATSVAELLGDAGPW